MNLYFSGYQDKINLASFFLCNLTLLEGDLVSQSKLFKFWPLGGALVKHFSPSSWLACSLNLKKIDLYLVPRGQFHSLWTNRIYSCILASYSVFFGSLPCLHVIEHFVWFSPVNLSCNMISLSVLSDSLWTLWTGPCGL